MRRMRNSEALPEMKRASSLNTPETGKQSGTSSRRKAGTISAVKLEMSPPELPKKRRGRPRKCTAV